jgi:hypothetical protein
MFSVISNAIFNENRTYRYRLWRMNDQPKKVLLYIMLNPSSADENRNDNTIKRLFNFTNDFGYDGFIVCNLCAIISTNSKKIKNKIILSKLDMTIIKDTLDKIPIIEKVVYAWGSNNKIDKKQIYKISSLTELLEQYGHKPYCFSFNNDGSPKHPLMLPQNETLVPYLHDGNINSEINSRYKKMHNVLIANVESNDLYLEFKTIEKIHEDANNSLVDINANVEDKYKLKKSKKSNKNDNLKKQNNSDNKFIEI